MSKLINRNILATTSIVGNMTESRFYPDMKYTDKEGNERQHDVCFSSIGTHSAGTTTYVKFSMNNANARNLAKVKKGQFVELTGTLAHDTREGNDGVVREEIVMLDPSIRVINYKSRVTF